MTNENKKLVKDLEQDETALTLGAGLTLATTVVMITDVSIKASNIAQGIPNEGVMYLGGLLLMGSGAMTLSYIARQHTMMKIKKVLAKKEEIISVETVEKEESPVAA